MTQLDNDWAQNTISDLLQENLKEQRAKRRWGVFFKALIIGYVIIMSIIVIRGAKGGAMAVPSGDFTAVVEINDEIMPGSDASADNIIPLLRKAFKNSHAKAIILHINSPGGSPVQAGQIHNEILRQRKEHKDKKVYAVIDDVGASGAYLLACAADQIYADQASLVGSIGVAMSSFGVVDGMHKLGIERRLYIAGNNKDMLDPFSPSKPHQVAMIQKELNIVHEQFIDVVKTGRGERLKITDDMFSGRVWVGSEAQVLGLIDGFGDKYTVSKDIVGTEEMYIYKPKTNLFSKLTNNFGTMKQRLQYRII